MKEQRLREVRRRGKGGEAELERSKQPRRGKVRRGGKVRWAEVKRWDGRNGSEKRGHGQKNEGREKAGVRGEVKVWGGEKVEEIRLNNGRWQAGLRMMTGQREPTIWVQHSPEWAPPDCWTCWQCAGPGPPPPTPGDKHNNHLKWSKNPGVGSKKQAMI